MKHFDSSARGPLTAALALLLLAACTPPQPEPPPPARTFDSAVVSLRHADMAKLRADIGKDTGLSVTARALALKLDPEGWLVALGASGREHNLPRAAAAMQSGDDAALADALGFGDQQLLADILGGGGSVFTRRADGRSFYDSGPQPIDVFDGVAVPGLPAGCMALEATVWGTLEQRQFRAGYGLNQDGATNVQAAVELAAESTPKPGEATRHALPELALPPTGLAADLQVQDFKAEHIMAARFTLLSADGDIHNCTLARDAAGWALVEDTRSTLDQRLAKLRDERMDFILRRAQGYERSSGRWPRGLHEITYEAHQLVDPTSPAARYGWADFEKKPAADLQLGEAGGAWAVASGHAGSQGRRAIAHDGTFFWLR